jgi:hypothetical protein
MEQKKTKPTNAQLQRRIANAVVHIDKDKSYQSVYWSDRGLRLETTDEYCVISTGFHRHVFNNFTSSGVSRPYLYTKRVIEIANENLKDIEVDGGYSFQRLLEVLKAKEDKSDYNIVTYVSWWFEIIFAPLYSINESEAGSFLVYEAYLHYIARQAVLLSEKKEDMTNKQFFNDVIKNMQDFIEGVDERVIFHKMTDEEMAQANIEAVQEQEQEQAMEAQINGASEN